jgi:hypothetical protein
LSVTVVALRQHTLSPKFKYLHCFLQIATAGIQSNLFRKKSGRVHQQLAILRGVHHHAGGSAMQRMTRATIGFTSY